jgi:hypothetical protein
MLEHKSPGGQNGNPTYRATRARRQIRKRRGCTVEDTFPASDPPSTGGATEITRAYAPPWGTTACRAGQPSIRDVHLKPRLRAAAFDAATGLGLLDVEEEAQQLGRERVDRCCLNIARQRTQSRCGVDGECSHVAPQSAHSYAAI